MAGIVADARIVGYLLACDPSPKCRYAALLRIALPIIENGRVAIGGQPLMATRGQYPVSADMQYWHRRLSAT